MRGGVGERLDNHQPGARTCHCGSPDFTAFRFVLQHTLPWKQFWFEAIGKDDVNPIELEEAADELRLLVSRALTGGKDIDLRPIQTDQCEKCVRAYIMKAWLHSAADPALPIVDWFWEGAPAGIAANFDCLDGFFFPQSR